MTIVLRGIASGDLLCGRGSERFSVCHDSRLECSFRGRVTHFLKKTQSRRSRRFCSSFVCVHASAAHSSNDPLQPSLPPVKVFEGGGVHESNPDTNAGDKDSIMVKLKRYGVAGMLSYGLLNTVYYLGMFLFAWFYISPAPSGLGYRAAAERFIKLFALVWAGSQVTKLLRAGCALALAPVIDKALTWLTDNSKFRSRAEIFGVTVASCFGLALIVFLVITCLWA